MKENVKEILISSGWYERRKIDITNMIKYLETSGYEVFPKVKEFLEEFGGISVIKSKPMGIGEKEDRTHIDVEKAIANYFTIGSFDAEERYASEKLVPVGQMRNENLVIFISESGKVYCNTGKIGDSFDEAWETIINENGFKSWGSY